MFALFFISFLFFYIHTTHSITFCYSILGRLVLKTIVIAWNNWKKKRIIQSNNTVCVQLFCLFVCLFDCVLVVIVVVTDNKQNGNVNKWLQFRDSGISMEWQFICGFRSMNLLLWWNLFSMFHNLHVDIRPSIEIQRIRVFLWAFLIRFWIEFEWKLVIEMILTCIAWVKWEIDTIESNRMDQY